MNFEIDLGKVGVTHGGTWNATTTYERLTVVLYDGSSYVSLINNTGVTPGTNGNIWQLVASKGQNGSGGSGDSGSGTDSGSGGNGGNSGGDSTSGDTIGVAYYSDGYLYWTKNGEWLLDPAGNMVRAQGIDGKDGDGSGSGANSGAFKSIVFKRSNTTPDTPSGGSYDSPVPTGWSDGIPSGESILWMSTRWFYKDDTLTSYTRWTLPAQATDTASVDFEYSSIVSPGNPTTNPAFWHNTGTTGDIWMAVRTKKNGVWGDWTVAKIRGENGTDGKDGKDGTSVNVKGSLDSTDQLPSTGTVGDTYIIDGNLWVWDGDSWVNCGQLKGDPGQSQYIHVAYSDDGGQTLTLNDGTDAGRYIGIYVSASSVRPLNASVYSWSKFRGEDGFGYEYIYILTADSSAPDVPESSNVDEYVPAGWSDDPLDVSEEKPYCWMCSRIKKSGAWSDFKGSKTAGGKAALFAKYGKDGANGKDGVDGVSPNTSFKSIVFKRSNTTPDIPDGGTYGNPVPDGWSDGVPSGEEMLWMSTRIFSSDGNAPQQSAWTSPSVAADNEYMDYEFSSAENPGVPSKDTPSGAEHNSAWGNESDSATVWMAMRVVSNGEYASGSSWKVLRIKGEKGADGTGISIKGTVTSASLLPNSGNAAGDAYIIDGDLYIWDGDSWVNVGRIQGTPGADGQTPFLHIKYSNDAGKTFTANNGETPGDYIGMYWDYVSADSTNVDSYKPWKAWKGEDGFGYEYIFMLTANSSAPSVPTATSLVDDFIPSGWSDNPGDVSEDKPYCWVCYRKKTDGVWGPFIGSKTDSGKASLYSHYGKDGDKGRGITEVVEMYAASGDGINAPSSWKTTVPELSLTNRFLWNYEIIKYSDGDSITTIPCVIGVYGTGRGITAVREYYLISSRASGITLSSDGWSTEVKTPTEYLPFLWNYEVIVYDDGEEQPSEPIVIGHYGTNGADGNPGIGISKVVEYYLVSDKAAGITVAGNAWSESVPTMTTAKPYLWNYEKIVYDDDAANPSTQSTAPCVIGHYGADGKDGRGISLIEEFYLATSLASVTTGTSGWNDKPSTQVISVDNPYLWNYERITYTDGTVDTTDPVIIGVFGVTSQNDVGFLGEVFGETNVDAQKGALVRTLVGVTSTGDTTKVVTMINASSVGADSGHGRLFIAAGMNGISTDAGISAAKFKVYEDGTTEVKDLVATNADISGKITAVNGTIGPFAIDEYTSLKSTYASGLISGSLELCGGYLHYGISNAGTDSTIDILVGLKSSGQSGAIQINVDTPQGQTCGIKITGSSRYDRADGIVLTGGADLVVGQGTCIRLEDGGFIALDGGKLAGEIDMSQGAVSIAGFHLPVEVESAGGFDLEVAGATYVASASGVIYAPVSCYTGMQFDLVMNFPNSDYSTLSLRGNQGVLLDGGTITTGATVKLYGGKRYHMVYASNGKWYVSS